MMARRSALGLLAGGLAALLASCGLLGREKTYRFKMTVEVDTPQGTWSGSSVYEVEGFGTNDLITGGKGSRSVLRGEATMVDLPDGRTLFALLKTVSASGHDNLAFMSMRALDPAFDYNLLESARRIAAGDGIRSPAEVDPADYPMLVTFRDIVDPTSVEKVDPANLAATFGEGVSLKRITVEVTDEPVTTGIEQRLSWLPKYYGRQFNGDRFQNLESLKRDGLSAVLSAGSFSAGLGLVGKD